MPGKSLVIPRATNVVYLGFFCVDVTLPKSLLDCRLDEGGRSLEDHVTGSENGCQQVHGSQHVLTRRSARSHRTQDSCFALGAQR